MIITTTPSVEGRKITQYHGIVVGKEEAVALIINGFTVEALALEGAVG